MKSGVRRDLAQKGNFKCVDYLCNITIILKLVFVLMIINSFPFHVSLLSVHVQYLSEKKQKRSADLEEQMEGRLAKKNVSSVQDE